MMREIAGGRLPNRSRVIPKVCLESNFEIDFKSTCDDSYFCHRPTLGS